MSGAGSFEQKSDFQSAFMSHVLNMSSTCPQYVFKTATIRTTFKEHLYSFLPVNMFRMLVALLLFIKSFDHAPLKFVLSNLRYVVTVKKQRFWPNDFLSLSKGSGFDFSTRNEQCSKSIGLYLNKCHVKYSMNN